MNKDRCRVYSWQPGSNNNVKSGQKVKYFVDMKEQSIMDFPKNRDQISSIEWLFT